MPSEEYLGTLSRVMKRLLLLAVLALPLISCASYFEIHDPGSDRTYYSKGYTSRKSGMITFKDANTGIKITIANSEVKKISKDEFAKATAKKDESKPGW